VTSWYRRAHVAGGHGISHFAEREGQSAPGRSGSAISSSTSAARWRARRLLALRDVLAQYEVACVGAQLPALLRGLYYVAWHPSVGTVSPNRSAFIERIQDGVHRDEQSILRKSSAPRLRCSRRPCSGRARGSQGAQTAA
jgi:Uncharacterized conserved protein (DUF2267)